MSWESFFHIAFQQILLSVYISDPGMSTYFDVVSRTAAVIL